MSDISDSDKPRGEERPESARRGDIARAFVIGLAVWFVFGPAVGFGFVDYADTEIVLDSSLVSSAGMRWLPFVLTSSYRGEYAPVHWIALRLQNMLWGDWAAGYHAVGVLFHALTAAALFLFCRAIGSSVYVAGVGTLLWAVHPLRTEPVAWIAQQSYPMGAFLVVCSGLVFLRLRVPARQSDFYRRRFFHSLKDFWGYAAGMGLLVLGLACQPRFCLWPVVLLLAGVLWSPPPEPFLEWEERRLTLGHMMRRLERVFWRLLPLILVGVVFAALMFTSQGSRTALTGRGAHDVGRNLLVACHSLMFHVGKTVLPTGLSPAYELPEPIALANLDYVIALGFMVVYLGLALGMLFRLPRVSFALRVFLVMLLPVLQIIPMSPPLSDSYSYLASVAMFWVVAAGLVWVAEKVGSRSRVAASMVLHVPGPALLVAAGAACLFSLSRWRDAQSLWTPLIGSDAASGKVYAEYALHKFRCGEGGVETVLESGSAHAQSSRFLQLARVEYSYRSGDREQAMAEAEAIIKQYPENPPAHHLKVLLLLKAQDEEAALEALRWASPLSSSVPRLRLDVAQALLARGMPGSARDLLLEATRDDPLDAEAWNLLAAAHARLDTDNKAFGALHNAVRLRPDYFEAMLNLGNLHMRAHGRLVKLGEKEAAATECASALDAYRGASRLRPESKEAKKLAREAANAAGDDYE